MNRKLPSLKLACLLPAAMLLAACSQESADTTQEADTQARMFKPVTLEQQAGDVIARVEDQAIHFSEVNTMLNSSAVVGLSLPALGTPARDRVRITLLDKIISANLMYLDAMQKKLDQDPAYKHAMKRFSNGMLAQLYYRNNLMGAIPVSEEEIQAEFSATTEPGAEFTEELRALLEATVRKRKMENRNVTELRNELRKGIDVTVYQKHFNLAGDAKRADDVVVAEAGGEIITWGEVSDRLIAAGKGAVKRDELAMEMDARLSALQTEIDTCLLAKKARVAGLDRDPTFLARYNEYHKTSLINRHRANLARDISPTDAELEAYFEANRKRIVMPEFRKVQMVMLEDEEQANTVKKSIEAGDITFFQAASDHSVAPDAKQNLGEIGWVGQGKLKPELDAVVFELGPGEIGGPVQAGGLWHVVTALDIRDAQNADIENEATRKYTRRMYVHEKLNDYVVDLRKNSFKVEVYEDVIIRLAQQEADMVKQLIEQAGDPNSVTQQRIEEMQKLMTP